MKTGRIEVHSHLLPGIDDGCADVSESLQCAQMLVDAGYSHLFCTTHVWPSLIHHTIQTLRHGVASLQEKLNAARIPLTLLPGGEWNLLETRADFEEIPTDQIITYGLEGKYLLFDFWAENWSSCKTQLLRAIAHLQGRGIKLVLAHPERISAIQRDQKVIDILTNQGVLLQLNSWCLADAPDRPTRAIAERLLREGRYFLIGTDLHNTSGMPQRLQGLEIARDIAGDNVIDELIIKNPRLLCPSAFG